jgi:HAD superfamily hydrolase (TIGR01509 family)
MLDKSLFKNKRFYIWDFDGCFCNSEPYHFLAYDKAFKDYGHCIDKSEYFLNFTHLGLGLKNEIETHNLNCDPKALKDKKNKYYMEYIENGEIKIFEIMANILSLIKSFGAKIAIASNSPAYEIEKILEKTQLRGSLDLIQGYEENLKKKPEPDIFLAAMKKLSANKDNSVIFEDSQRGLMAAQRSSCKTNIWIRTQENKSLETDVPYAASLTHAELYDELKLQKESSNVDG